jgi:hypothetical protein
MVLEGERPTQHALRFGIGLPDTATGWLGTSALADHEGKQSTWETVFDGLYKRYRRGRPAPDRAERPHRPCPPELSGAR